MVSPLAAASVLLAPTSAPLMGWSAASLTRSCTRLSYTDWSAMAGILTRGEVTHRDESRPCAELERQRNTPRTQLHVSLLTVSHLYSAVHPMGV